MNSAYMYTVYKPQIKFRDNSTERDGASYSKTVSMSKIMRINITFL
jgi:hypothetical protein